jgi:hypothetical protein
MILILSYFMFLVPCLAHLPAGRSGGSLVEINSGGFIFWYLFSEASFWLLNG